MYKHTPGPWKLNSSGHLVGSNGEHVLLSDCGLGFASKHEHPEREANARLISAAADMLLALEFAEDQVRCFYTATNTVAKSRDENRARKEAALQAIRAAIAKATGGQP